jgi:amino acid transporter
MVGLPSESYVRRALPRGLSTFDMVTIFVMAGLLINNPVETVGAGVVSVTYWIIGAGVFLAPCLIASAQLGTMFFNEGSEGSLYNWTQKALGSFWSFFVGVSFWASGVLGMVGSAGIAVSYLQGINHTILADSREQGLFIVFILIVSGVISMQRFRLVKHLVNYTTILLLIVIALLGIAAVAWLAGGHPAATSMAPTGSIGAGNYAAFSAVIFAFLGANVSMALGGEISDRKVVTRHLFRGGVIILVGYLIVTFALLGIEGPQAAAEGPFSIISAITQVLGKPAGDFAAICMVTFFLTLTVLFGSIFSRFLLVGAIDRRIPLSMGRLDENRVPLAAIITQTTIAVLFASVVFLLPYLISLGNPVNLTNEFFTVSLYAHSIIWAIASAFLFLDLLVIMLRDRRAFQARRIFPMLVLWASIVLAPIACALAIIVALSSSPIPELIPTSLWGGIVGILTLVWLIFAGIMSMLASGEAAWEDFGSNVSK